MASQKPTVRYTRKSQSTALPITEKTVPRLAYKVSEAAKALGVDRTTLYSLVRDGRIKYSRLSGGTIIIGVAAIEEFLRGDGAA